MTEVKSTDDCECTDLEGGMNSYISLEAELEDWFEKPYDELPKDLRKRVDRSFRPLRPPLSQKEQQKREEQQMRAREKQTLKEYQKREEQQKDELKRTREKQRKKAWDNHTPDDRRKRACLWDGWENPAFERERRRLWDLGLLKDMHKVKEEIEKWETTPHLSISELESKERHIEELNNELQTIEENISDGFEREERLAAELIAAEIEAYAEHDRIAAEKRAEEQRLEAIEQEDENEPEAKQLQNKPKTPRSDYLDVHMDKFFKEEANYSAANFTMYMQGKGAKFLADKMTWTDPTGEPHEWKMSNVTNRLSEHRITWREKNP